MGTVLEMTVRTLPVLALAVLSACGLGDRGTYFKDAATLIRSGLARDAGPVDQSLTLPEAITDAVPGPLMVGVFPERNAKAAMVFLGGNGTVTSWAAGGGITIAFDDGVLTATRGLGGDLMSADLDEVKAGLRGGGQAVRVHRYLDGEEHLQARAFVCDYSRTGATVVEDCTGPELGFENQYVLDSRGRIRESLQWIGPQAGYLRSAPIRDR